MVRRRTAVTFDGHDLTQRFGVGGLQRPLMPREGEYVSVPGADGALFVGVTDATRTVRLTLTYLDADPAERMEAFRELASWLHVDSPRALAISEDGGLWYKAMPNAQADGARALNADSFVVEFTCDSCLYGDEASEDVTLSSGGTATIEVGGTLPTPMLLSGEVTASGVWAISLDGAAQYTGTQGAEGAPETLYYEIDAETRVAKVGQDETAALEAFALAPTDRWMWLAPGTHTLAATGCSATLTVGYVERWA